MGQDEEAALLARITTSPDILGGKPAIRGKRLAVEHVLGDLGAGETTQALLEAYPFLEPDDIRACLLYAERAVRILTAAHIRPEEPRAPAG